MRTYENEKRNISVDRKDTRFCNKKRGTRPTVAMSMFRDERLVLYRLGAGSPTKGFSVIMEWLRASKDFKKFMYDRGVDLPTLEECPSVIESRDLEGLKDKTKMHRGYKNYDTWSVSMAIGMSQEIYEAACRTESYYELSKRLNTLRIFETKEGIHFHGNTWLDTRALDSIIEGMIWEGI